MDLGLTRWSVLIIGLAGLIWLHVSISGPDEPPNAVENSVRKLAIIEGRFLIAHDWRGPNFVWSFDSLEFLHRIGGKDNKFVWPTSGTLATRRGGQLEGYDIATGEWVFETERRRRLSPLMIDASGRTLFAIETNSGELHLYDRASMTLERSHSLYPQGIPTDKRGGVWVRIGPDALLLHAERENRLYYYSVATDTLRPIGSADRIPEPVWSLQEPNAAFEVEDVVYVVTETFDGAFDKPADLPSDAELIAVRGETVVFGSRQGMMFHDMRTGMRTRTVDAKRVLDLPGIDPTAAANSNRCGYAWSNDASKLLLDCTRSGTHKVAILDLATGNTQPLPGRKADQPKAATSLLLTNDGHAVIAYGRTIDVIRGGATKRLSLHNPAFPLKDQWRPFRWLYRAILLFVVGVMAFSMARTAGGRFADNPDMAPQFSVMKGFTILAMFIIAAFIVVVMWILNNGNNSGMMGPGVLVVLLAMVLVAGLTKLAVLMSVAASIGARIAHALGANPKDVVVGSCLATFGALLFAPLVF